MRSVDSLETLLDVTLRQLLPEIEKERSEILQKQREQKQKLIEFENQILEALMNSKESIIENEELSVALDNAKSQSVEIQRDIENLIENQRKLDEERNQYRPVARK